MKIIETEAEFLQRKIRDTETFLRELPAVYEAQKKLAEQEVDELLRKAGIYAQVAQIKQQLADNKAKIQWQADHLSAVVAVYRDIYTTFHTGKEVAVEWPVPKDEDDGNKDTEE